MITHRTLIGSINPAALWPFPNHRLLLQILATTLLLFVLSAATAFSSDLNEVTICRAFAEKALNALDFVPKTHDNLVSDFAEHEFAATQYQRISGYVRLADDIPVEGIAVFPYTVDNGTGVGVYTDANGYYSVGVPLGWSGLIQISAQSKPFSFDPPERSYSNVVEDIVNQNFVAVPFLSISGCIRASDGTPMSDATVYTSWGQRVYSDTNGFYSVRVPNGWNGTIDASLAGYKMEPQYRTYENITANLTDQDFEAQPYKTIRGKVHLLDGHGVADVFIYVDNYGWSTSTDENGDYAARVPPTWSGSISPRKSYYSIQPGYRSYQNVESDLAGQDFSATPYPVVSGYIRTSDGHALEDVWIYPSDISSHQTDSDGYYCVHVPPGWSGSIDVYMSMYSMDPERRTYENVSADQTNQSYTASYFKVISGHIRTVDGAPVPNVDVTADNGGQAHITTDQDGYYSVGVPPGWSGNVVFKKEFTSFSPAGRSYSDVISDINSENVLAAYLNRISGCIRAADRERAYPVYLRADNCDEEAYVDYDGYYQLGVPPGWSGSVRPQGWFFQMEPESISYSNVTGDISNQDYSATRVSKSLSDIKRSPDGTFVICPEVMVTGIFDDCYYIESGDRTFGIRVHKPEPYYEPGYTLYLEGFTATDQNGERSIDPRHVLSLSYLSSCEKDVNGYLHRVLMMRTHEDIILQLMGAKRSWDSIEPLRSNKHKSD
jgi:hypothetical protein